MTRDKIKRAVWDRNNTVLIGVRLMRSTDADILEYIEDRIAAGETKQGIIKRSLRSTMQQEGYQDQKDGSE